MRQNAADMHNLVDQTLNVRVVWTPWRDPEAPQRMGATDGNYLDCSDRRPVWHLGAPELSGRVS